jgi:predicted nucleic acid-binding protein
LAREREEALTIQQTRKISTSLICIYELAKLSELTVQEIIADNRVEKLKPEDVQQATNVYRELREKGEMANQLDILIAAQAINRDLPLLTADTDFRKIEGLKTEYYRETQ